ncbi:MAG: hypothetical protein J6A84_01845 [Clostridia bacterium]|nr:hypothetical protein [Clostridia bacterium]
MRYYLCAEGGGSKLHAIVYDENFNIVRTAFSGSVNSVFRDIEQIQAEMEALLRDLIPPHVTELAGADLALVGSGSTFADLLCARFPDVDIRFHAEGAVALAASCVEEGIVAQAGTGSDAFLIQKDRCHTVGGWGCVIGDQGSGYDIGRRGVVAAIRHNDGWGEPTLITELLCDTLGYNDGIKKKFNDLVNYCLDRTRVAALSRVVGAAAARGDQVALDIVRDAGHLLAQQVLCSIRQAGGSFRGPIIASGGAWRTSPVMFETFKDEVLAVHPSAVVKRQLFEPVVGCIVLRFGISEQLTQTLCENFKDFLYNQERNGTTDCEHECN